MDLTINRISIFISDFLLSICVFRDLKEMLVKLRIMSKKNSPFY